jgi:hypothetical protein
MNGAAVGDLREPDPTCELNGANPFDYLTELLRHPAELTMHAAEWMPWNYRAALARIERLVAAHIMVCRYGRKYWVQCLRLAKTRGFQRLFRRGFLARAKRSLAFSSL